MFNTFTLSNVKKQFTLNQDQANNTFPNKKLSERTL